MRPEPNWVQGMAINPMRFTATLHSMQERAVRRAP